MTRRKLKFFAMRGNLTIDYPANVKLEMSGNDQAGYILTVHAIPVTKEVKAQVIQQLTVQGRKKKR